MSDSSPTEDITLNLELPAQHYQLLAEAAALTGLTIRDYIIHQGLSAAIADTALNQVRPSPASDPSPKNPSDYLKPQPPDETLALASLLQSNPQDINKLAKAILSSLAWSAPEILQKERATERDA